MKTQKITIKLPKSVAKRIHFVLFAENTPFKPKVVESKKAHTRKPKHRAKILD
jgi:hypothetical protein